MRSVPLAMTLAQSLTIIIVFWAIIGGLGASLLLPAMQSLIHGNFGGAAQKRAYALVGASAAIAAAIGPLLGGFVTMYLSWRVGFMLEPVVIAIVLTPHDRQCRTRTAGLASKQLHARSVQQEVLEINRDSTNLALQVALLVPILASGLGLFNSFRMLRLPDIESSGGLKGAVLG